MTNPKHEELVLHGIVSNPQTPFEFVFGLSFQVFRSSFPNSGYSMFPIFNLVLKFRFRIDVFFLDKAFFVSIGCMLSKTF